MNFPDVLVKVEIHSKTSTIKCTLVYLSVTMQTPVIILHVQQHTWKVTHLSIRDPLTTRWNTACIYQAFHLWAWWGGGGFIAELWWLPEAAPSPTSPLLCWLRNPLFPQLTLCYFTCHLTPNPFTRGPDPWHPDTPSCWSFARCMNFTTMSERMWWCFTRISSPPTYTWHQPFTQPSRTPSASALFTATQIRKPALSPPCFTRLPHSDRLSPACHNWRRVASAYGLLVWGRQSQSREGSADRAKRGDVDAAVPDAGEGTIRTTPSQLQHMAFCVRATW